jgi:HAD superfamily hydrolase (TIGR01490 family)
VAVAVNKTNNEKKVAAFFDVDNTLVRGATTILFGKVVFRDGTIRRRDIWRFAFEQMMFIRRGEKNNSLAGFKERALSVTKGYAVSSLEPLMQTVYESEIKPRLWPKTVAAVKEHLAQGHEVWLITAAPVELAELIAKDLGATGALGTVVGRNNGVLTGELVGEALHGQAKRKAAKKLAVERGISLSRSWAYSDSVNDLPLLTLVKHAVAVNPDKALTRYAEAANWDIVRFKKRDLKRS